MFDLSTYSGIGTWVIVWTVFEIRMNDGTVISTVNITDGFLFASDGTISSGAWVRIPLQSPVVHKKKAIAN